MRQPCAKLALHARYMMKGIGWGEKASPPLAVPECIDSDTMARSNARGRWTRIAINRVAAIGRYGVIRSVLWHHQKSRTRNLAHSGRRPVEDSSYVDKTGALEWWKKW
jgi:hypothetical protein